jgi:hypothetical protein
MGRGRFSYSLGPLILFERLEKKIMNITTSDAWTHGYSDGEYGFTYISEDANAYAAGYKAAKLDREARELHNKLESKPRFSLEWSEVLREVEEWTKKNNRPLSYTYNE